MAQPPIEKLKKEAAKANAALQSEKKKNRELKAKNQTLKEGWLNKIKSNVNFALPTLRDFDSYIEDCRDSS
jgi:hypothetical protein